MGYGGQYQALAALLGIYTGAMRGENRITPGTRTFRNVERPQVDGERTPEQRLVKKNKHRAKMARKKKRGY